MDLLLKQQIQVNHGLVTIGTQHQWLENITYNKLIFGVPFAGRDNWDNCVTLAEQDCANPKPTAWTKSEVNSIVTANFAKTGGKRSS